MTNHHIAVLYLPYANKVALETLTGLRKRVVRILLEYFLVLYMFNRNLTFLGNAQVIEKLHKSGAVLNIETKFEKRTSLHIASSLGWVDVVQALLDLQANPNKTDIYGSTPLQVACMAGQILYYRFPSPFALSS